MSDEYYGSEWHFAPHIPTDFQRREQMAREIKALTAKLGEVEAERDALLEIGLAAYFAGSGDAKARERDAYKRGHRAGLNKAVNKLEQPWEARARKRAIEAILAIPDSEGDDT